MAVLQAFTDKINANMSVAREVFYKDTKGWIICACVLLITVVRSGITYSFGVFVVELEAVYHGSLAEQNWIGTLSFCISLSCAPVSVAFIRMFKYRGYRIGGLIGTAVLTVSCLSSSFVRSLEWMFLTHSLLYGVGSSLIYMASSLVIGEYFDKDHKYHVLATSILLCGYPIGSLLFNPINAWLVTRFGWRTAFRVASAMICAAGVPCCWVFSSKQEIGHSQFVEEEEETKAPIAVEEAPPMPRRCCTLAELKIRPQILLWYMANLLSYLGFFMPFLNLAFYMELKNIPPVKSSWALTLLSLAECMTYIIASFMGDYLKGRLVYVNIVASAALAFICIIWPFIDVAYGIILSISIAMGGFLGLTIVYTYAASVEVTKLPIDVAWAFTNLWSGMGILVGPFFSGVIFDFRQSYDDVFYVVGFLYVLDAFIFAGIPFLDRYQERHGLGDYANMDVPGEQTQTFRIGKRSLSKSSLVNGEPGEGPIKEYGTTETTTPPAKPPPPLAGYPAKPPPPAGGFPRQNSLGSTAPLNYRESNYDSAHRQQQEQQQPVYPARSSSNPFAQAEYPPRHDPTPPYGR